MQSIDLTRIPRHIAVIMDGNGRWAEMRGMPRASGHKAGIEGVRALIQASYDIGVRYLTIYSFSTENWSRPLQEVNTLMALFARTMRKELKALDAKGVRVRVIGDICGLPDKTRNMYEEAIRSTISNDKMDLIIAANYGSRDEIINAVKLIGGKLLSGEMEPGELEALDATSFSTYLDTSGIPDPDLLIRTSGEYRLSNFLLYQIAYSEIYVTDTFWPDFRERELLSAISAYQGRSRRFGGIAESSEA